MRYDKNIIATFMILILIINISVIHGVKASTQDKNNSVFNSIIKVVTSWIKNTLNGVGIQINYNEKNGMTNLEKEPIRNINQTKPTQPVQALNIQIKIKKGDNLISIPYGSYIPDKVKKELIGTWYLYNTSIGAYQQVKNIEPGIGYYVKSDYDYNFTVKAKPYPKLIYDLKKGWNLIAAPQVEVNSSIFDKYDIKGPYSYRGLTEQEILIPGFAYWVYSPSNKEVEIGLFRGLSEEECDITECTDITTPGYHALCNNIHYTSTSERETCINILTDNVELDGKGFYCGWGENIGVKVDNHHDINIHDLVIRNSNFPIMINNSDNILINKNNLYNNTEGIWLVGHTTRSRIINNNISANNDIAYDVYLGDNSNNNMIKGNHIFNAGGVLIHSDNNSIIDNTITNNTNGIVFGNYAYNNTLINNTFCNNRIYDIKEYLHEGRNYFHSNTCNITSPNPHDYYCDDWCITEEEPEECDITECTDITTPGYHALCNDIYYTSTPESHGACINISADNVELDSRGYSIISTGESGHTYGIYVNHKTNISILNFTINNFGTGIYVGFGSRHRIENNTISNCIFTGINIYATNQNNISYNNVFNCNNGQGISIHYSANNSVHDNVVSNNKGGLSLEYCSLSNFYNNKINNNIYGIYLFGGAHRDNFTNNSICHNTNKDIFLSIGHFNTWNENSCDTYYAPGYVISDFCDYPCAECDITECTDITTPGYHLLCNDLHASGIGETDACINVLASDVELDCRRHSISGEGIGNGIKVDNEDSYIHDCKIHSFNSGININHASNITIKTSDIYNNSRSGVYIYNSMNNSIIYNNITHNKYGLVSRYSKYNTIKGNIIDNNTVEGMMEITSYNNTLENNEICYNEGYDIYSIYPLSNNRWENNSCDSSETGWLDIFCDNWCLPHCIDHCMDITRTGKYKLCNDIEFSGTELGWSGACINIQANNVEIDGKGYKIINTDPMASGNGIKINGYNSSNIHNVTIQNFAFGIYLNSSYNNTIMHNAIKENAYYDIFIHTSSDIDCDNRIIDNIGSGDRPILYYNSAVRLSGNNISELILCNADNSDIDNLSIISSDVFKNNGIIMIRTDNSNIINSNSLNTEGLFLYNSSNNTIINNNMRGDYEGILLYLGSNSNQINNNTLFYNRDTGIYIDSCSNNSIINNSVTSAAYSGIYLSFTTDNKIKYNNITNSLYGLQLYSSYNNLLNNNIISSSRRGSSSIGIWLHSSSRNDINNNIVAHQSNLGISLDSSHNNNLTNNTVIYNNYGIYSPSDDNLFIDNKVCLNTIDIFANPSSNIFEANTCNITSPNPHDDYCDNWCRAET